MSTETPTAIPFAKVATAPDTGPMVRRKKISPVINGVRCDPTTAERVLTNPGGGPVERERQLHRFDEVIYQSPEGSWFVVRPLDPEEARQWIEDVDEVDARQRFPDGPAD